MKYTQDFSVNVILTTARLILKRKYGVVCVCDYIILIRRRLLDVILMCLLANIDALYAPLG